MHRPPPLTFARFVGAPENRSALAAVQQVAEYLGSRSTGRLPNPLLLHGPAGVGKTHLAAALVTDVTRRRPGVAVSVLPAGDFAGLLDSPEADDLLETLRQSDLLIVEDLQHLAARAAETFVQIMDFLHARQVPMVFTALAGPRHLDNLPGRLASRLVGGLVVGLEPLAAPGRRALLEQRAQQRQLAVRPEVLDWLAEHLTGGGRQLEGAVAHLEALTRLHHRPPDLELVRESFREQVEAGRPTVERIVQRVGGYFRVEPRQLQSRRRSRQVLLPRQVGMYLARRLTGLSLEQIGAYFGGRDHSTVLHACRKVERALETDAVLSGAVRQLHADLT